MDKHNDKDEAIMELRVAFLFRKIEKNNYN